MSKNLNEEIQMELDKLSEDIKALLFKSEILEMYSIELKDATDNLESRSFQLIDYIESSLTELHGIAGVIKERLYDIDDITTIKELQDYEKENAI